MAPVYDEYLLGFFTRLYVASISSFLFFHSEDWGVWALKSLSYQRRYAGIAPPRTRARPIDNADPKQRSMLATAHIDSSKVPNY